VTEKGVFFSDKFQGLYKEISSPPPQNHLSHLPRPGGFFEEKKVFSMV